MGMTVADTNYGMAAVQVQILLPLVVPNMASFPFYDVHIEKRIYVE